MIGDDIYDFMGIVVGLALMIITAQGEYPFARFLASVSILLTVIGSIGVRDNHPTTYISLIILLMAGGILFGLFFVFIIWRKVIRIWLLGHDEDENHLPPTGGGSA